METYTWAIRLLEFIVVASAVGAILFRAFRKAVNESIQPTLESIHDDVRAVKREVEINSGKSLKDHVLRGFEETDRRVSHLEGEISVISQFVNPNVPNPKDT